MNTSHLDKLLEGYAKNGPAGCACAVAQGGKVIYKGFAGYADREGGRLIGEDTVYRLYSMTKVIVCAAALILYERGGFLLNEPLYAFLPEFRDSRVFVRRANGSCPIEPVKQPILIKHAFAMACGLPYPNGTSLTGRELLAAREELEANGPYTLRQFVRRIAQAPLDFEPGTQWMYGHGHELVAALIEAVSGRTVGEFLKKEIFDPLNMASTGYRFFGDIEGRMAVGYNRAADGALTPMPADRDKNHQPGALFEGGGAGLFSTLDDYLRFTQMMALGGELEGARVLGRKTIDLMRANQLNDAQLAQFRGGYTAGYGYGLGVRTMMDIAHGNANVSIGEFGWTGALGTYASIDPAEGASVVYMHQMMPNMEEYHHLRVRAAAYALLR